MRYTALALTLLLTGCIADVFAPATPQPLGFSFDQSGIEQNDTGLRIDFGRAQDSTIESASRLFGALPDEIVELQECGAGRVVSARWPGVSLNFLGGDFTGWVLGAPGLPVEGITVGQARDTLPPLTFFDTSLGAEFELNGIFGLILPGEAEIAQLWSGTTCFFR